MSCVEVRRSLFDCRKFPILFVRTTFRDSSPAFFFWFSAERLTTFINNYETPSFPTIDCFSDIKSWPSNSTPHFLLRHRLSTHAPTLYRSHKGFHKTLQPANWNLRLQQISRFFIAAYRHFGVSTAYRERRYSSLLLHNQFNSWIRILNYTQTHSI